MFWVAMTEMMDFGMDPILGVMGLTILRYEEIKGRGKGNEA